MCKCAFVCKCVSLCVYVSVCKCNETYNDTQEMTHTHNDKQEITHDDTHIKNTDTHNDTLNRILQTRT